jgi:hypothetical protein
VTARDVPDDRPDDRSAEHVVAAVIAGDEAAFAAVSTRHRRELVNYY